MPGYRDGTWRQGMLCRFRHVGSLLSDGTRAALIIIGSVRIRQPFSKFLVDWGSREHFGIWEGPAELTPMLPGQLLKDNLLPAEEIIHER